MIRLAIAVHDVQLRYIAMNMMSCINFGSP